MDLFLDELVKTLFQAAVPIVTGAVVWVLVQVAKRVGLSISAENEARIKYYVHDAIYFAEEKAEAYLKRGLKPVQGKMQIAVTQLLDKVPGITQLEAQHLIEAELPKLGLGASAASFGRSVVLAATNDTK